MSWPRVLTPPCVYAATTLAQKGLGTANLLIVVGLRFADTRNIEHDYGRSLSPDTSGWEKASLKAKSHPGARPDGFCGELPAGIPVPFTLWIVT